MSVFMFMSFSELQKGIIRWSKAVESHLCSNSCFYHCLSFFQKNISSLHSQFLQRSCYL